MRTRLGLFGGTFDPPHVGHLALAECARDQLSLARVLFVPTGAPPHKRGRALTPARHRVAMTRLAVRGNAAFEVLTLEVRRPGPSYTIDTLRELTRHHPRAEWFLLLGEDSLDDFPTWRESRAIRALATLAVARRAGRREARRRTLRCEWLEAPPLDVSSSVLRRRIADRGSVRYLVPDAVERYIARHRLYRKRG